MSSCPGAGQLGVTEAQAEGHVQQYRNETVASCPWAGQLGVTEAQAEGHVQQYRDDAVAWKAETVVS